MRAAPEEAHDTLLDEVLRTHLRNVARMLNFMARAKANGIDVSDVHALASVSAKRWRAVNPTASYKTAEENAEFMVEKLLELSVWELCVLAERAAVLRGELERLGVVIGPY
ncbi:hypothetical protein F5Y19DRAFT_428325 [Xylariaceae sp. FL1651]|nr:hypothetical protein F5Y19DRAFT_428325 [Xylariaceae sp. FL1651]